MLSATRKAATVVITLSCLLYLTGGLEIAIFGAFGALCLSMMELPGSPRQVIFTMLAGSSLSMVSIVITALTTTQSIAITIALTSLTFFFHASGLW